MNGKFATTKSNDKPKRMDRLIEERVHDTYQHRGTLTEPTRCPQCGAVYHNGRWQWAVEPPRDAHEHICSACHRVNDNYPAGEVTLSGSFLRRHKDEIVSLVRNLESIEKKDHPLNRIIAILDSEEGILITTTDVHLPQRIGKAIQRAFKGQLDIHFDKGGYFTSITWQRES